MGGPTVARGRGGPRKEPVMKGGKSTTKENTSSNLECSLMAKQLTLENPKSRIDLGVLNQIDEPQASTSRRWSEVVLKPPQSPTKPPEAGLSKFDVNGSKVVRESHFDETVTMEGVQQPRPPSSPPENGLSNISNGRKTMELVQLQEHRRDDLRQDSHDFQNTTTEGTSSTNTQSKQSKNGYDYVTSPFSQLQ